MSATTTTVVLQTSEGEIAVEVYFDAPVSAENFVATARRGLYDGSFVRRVTPDWVQFGQAEMVTVLGSSPEIELPQRLRFTGAGIVACAQAEGRNTPDFVITTRPLPEYDGKWTIIGRVLRGMQVLQCIAALPVGMDGRPTTQVTVRGASAQQHGVVARPTVGVTTRRAGPSKLLSAVLA